MIVGRKCKITSLAQNKGAKHVHFVLMVLFSHGDSSHNMFRYVSLKMNAVPAPSTKGLNLEIPFPQKKEVIMQGGPLLVINGVITTINGRT